jgi:hypothetical protein
MVFAARLRARIERCQDVSMRSNPLGTSGGRFVS